MNKGWQEGRKEGRRDGWKEGKAGNERGKEGRKKKDKRREAGGRNCKIGQVVHFINIKYRLPQNKKSVIFLLFKREDI